MGLSKSQKKRLYGDKAQLEATTPPTRTTAKMSAADSRYRQGELYADPTKSSSNMYLVVGFIVSFSLIAYNYLWVLPQFSHFAGNTVPELLFSFGRDEIEAFAGSTDPDYIAQYATYHLSAALIVPFVCLLTWTGMIFASHLSLRERSLHLPLPVLFAIIYGTGNLALNAALANPAGSVVGIASALISARWALFILLLAQLAYLCLRLVRGKVDAFTRGELPEQQ
ncbi:hypothetical protein [Rothia sp. ZJ932]|uniref:hypothetical protein n=1 Tax=Rothia sp. ZJ932 TaxID=2810516 RepID=UPI0019684EA3|nr:hypothetical protein [Rothia sp. ZJ932]QRZ61917.1 hypothetical protein JR346_01940 [Rothia sp. ZJ932]